MTTVYMPGKSMDKDILTFPSDRFYVKSDSLRHLGETISSHRSLRRPATNYLRCNETIEFIDKPRFHQTPVQFSPAFHKHRIYPCPAKHPEQASKVNFPVRRLSAIHHLHPGICQPGNPVIHPLGMT